MILGLRARRAWWPCLAAAVLSVIALLVAGGVVPLPRILAGTSEPINSNLIVSIGFAPIAAVVCGADCLAFESLARRRLAHLDAAIVASVTLPPVVLGIAAYLAGDQDSGLALIRDATAFCALTVMLAALVTISTAASLPVVYFLVVAELGRGSDGSFYWWAWLLAPASIGSAALGCGLALIATVVFTLFARRRAAVRAAGADDGLGD